MKFGVVVFPGSNCDHDAYHVISKHVGQPVDFIWHRDIDLSSYDAVIIPGGFLMAITCARVPGAVLTSNEFDQGIRRPGQSGAGHLQRLSDSLRSDCCRAP